MIGALVAGAAAGIGLLAFAWAVVPPRQNLALAVDRFETQRATARTAMSAQSGRRGQVGRWLVTRAHRHGFTLAGLRADLALLDRTVEAHLVSKIATAAVGLALPGLLTLTLVSTGISVPLAVPAVAAVMLAAGFFLLPDISVRYAARARRDELRRALACYLDLVSMALAGGRGTPEALPSAAHIGRGWAFDLIWDTLTHARYTGTTPWDALRELGTRVQVTELRDLGNALSLVSDDGAKIRESLRARAATARSRQLAEAEGAAEKAAESIKNAHLLLGFAFLLFLGFPAVAAVMAV
jgi:tight adherence protein C